MDARRTDYVPVNVSDRSLVEHLDEWVGGVFKLPSYLTDGGTSVSPAVTLWVEPLSGYVFCAELAAPGQELTRAAEILRKVAARPKHRPAGAPLLPRRLRVASAELAAALTRDLGDPGVTIVVAPTPELSTVKRAMKDHFKDPGLDLFDRKPLVAIKPAAPKAKPAKTKRKRR